MPDLHDEFAGLGGCYVVGVDGIRRRADDIPEPEELSDGGSNPAPVGPGKIGRGELRD